jgi:hypothetical protein
MQGCSVEHKREIVAAKSLAFFLHRTKFLEIRSRENRLNEVLEQVGFEIRVECVHCFSFIFHHKIWQ